MWRCHAAEPQFKSVATWKIHTSEGIPQSNNFSPSTPLSKVAKKAGVLKRRKSKKYETNQNSSAFAFTFGGISALYTASPQSENVVNETQEKSQPVIDVPVYLEEPKASMYWNHNFLHSFCE